MRTSKCSSARAAGCARPGNASTARTGMSSALPAAFKRTRNSRQFITSGGSRFKLGAEDVHHAFHAGIGDGFCLKGFRLRGGLIIDDGEHRGREPFLRLVEVVIEEPFAQADVAPHEAFARLLLVAADDRRDAMTD